MQRAQMVGIASGAVPTDLQSLIGGYQDARKRVDLPQGGIANPMAISYDPTKMYRLFRGTPTSGYNDSESVNGTASGWNFIPQKWGTL